ncbi:unnamed protein product [Cyprideis torosa]|uniref:PrdX deacylase domain-containing protein 1 n=1 Tax=Cyprideis torosa TaxID=163714 RepID=A0A7R9A100_9CRUS|nr:unnamed protein product [Cyprideis torosa]CAG0911499.1 unnamed protein product [Cyprideis torosa]
MTPAINLLKQRKIIFKTHVYEHDPKAASYGLEAAEALSLDDSRVFKTLLVAPPGSGSLDLAVAVLPVNQQLDLKRMASVINTKKLDMADPGLAQRVTGYLLGGISPLGQKKRLPTVIDSLALPWETIFFSGGRRGLEIELAPHDLVTLCGATVADIVK